MKSTLLVVAILGNWSSNSFAQGFPELCDNIWVVTYSGGIPSGITITCTTGGNYQCPLAGYCPEPE